MAMDARWPLRADRYDPYDPGHPMWTDTFWGRYCTGPRSEVSTDCDEPNPPVAGPSWVSPQPAGPGAERS